MDKQTIFPHWENLKLTDEEQVAIHLDADRIAGAEKELQNALVCKILTPKLANVENFISSITKLWNMEEQLSIVNVGFNLYLCLFKTLNQKRSVLENGPWCFHSSLLVFQQPPTGYGRLADLEFQYASFWLHFHLPLCCFSRKMAMDFGNVVGSFEGVEMEDDEGMCWGRSLRVRIRIDVNKPLRRVVKSKVESMGIETFVPITYEKLPDFCYGCGKLGHVLKDCDLYCETAEEDLEYGDWLREMDSKGSDDQNPESSESAPDGWGGPVAEEREVAVEDRAENGKEKIEEESVDGVISGEIEEEDENIKESMRTAGVYGITKGDNGDVVELHEAVRWEDLVGKGLEVSGSKPSYLSGSDLVMGPSASVVPNYRSSKGKNKKQPFRKIKAQQLIWEEGPEMGLDQMDGLATWSFQKGFNGSIQKG